MQIINQIGHIQHWGISPATNVLQYVEVVEQKPIKILLSGCSDIRHIMKTVSDVCLSGKFSEITFYIHQTKKQLLCRCLLQLHILHEQHLNFEERTQIFLDLYGNALIKERNARYLHQLREDLLNFIHEEKKIQTPLKHFLSLKLLKFQERDQMSQIIQSWSIKTPFDINQLRDTRLRCLFADRYDYRANLIDWDFSMLLTEVAGIVHFYHYKEWRLTGIAFEQRFSTYSEPNRTLSSYVAGRKKVEKTSCLVRGYWGDLVCSPYLAMGINTDYPQKDLLFKKSNYKYIGHSVQLTQYHMMYWLTMLQNLQPYVKIFRDYYRTDEKTKEEMQKKDEQKKKNKDKNYSKKDQLAIKQQAEEEQTQQEIKQQVKEIKQQQQKDEQKQQIKEQKQQIKGQKQQIKQQKQQQKQQIKQQNKQQKEQQQQVDTKKQKPSKKNKKKQQQLDSDEQKTKKEVQQRNAKQIYNDNDKPVLSAFKKVNLKINLLGMPIQQLTKSKYVQHFDVIVLGFAHSGFINKQIVSTLKKGGYIMCEKATYLIPKKKQERLEINKNLEQLIKKEDLKIHQQTTDFIIGLKKQ